MEKKREKKDEDEVFGLIVVKLIRNRCRKKFGL